MVVAAVVLIALFFLWSPQSSNAALAKLFGSPSSRRIGHAVYVVEGTAAARATIIYRVRDWRGRETQSREENAALPWVYDVDFYSGQLLAVNAEVTRGLGPIRCRVHVGTTTTEPIAMDVSARAVACATLAPSEEPPAPAPAPSRPAPDEPKQVEGAASS
jgi:hypothetical protein